MLKKFSTYVLNIKYHRVKFNSITEDTITKCPEKIFLTNKKYFTCMFR